MWLGVAVKCIYRFLNLKKIVSKSDNQINLKTTGLNL